MKRWIAGLMMALPLPAFADDCGGWTASLEEDEGGSVMTARTCSGTGDATHELFVRCGAPGRLMIRYIPAAPEGSPSEKPGYVTELAFSFGQQTFRRPAQYEAMDGALVADIDVGAPLLAALRSAARMTLADVATHAAGADFSLEGSKAALEKVAASCPKS